MNKALLIVEALYLGYSLVFLFYNATNHSFYAKDTLRIKEMNQTLEENNHTCVMVGIKKIVLTKYIL